MKKLTEAQLYVLAWINEHGSFKRSAHPDHFRRLGIPPEHRNAFNIRTLHILMECGYLSSNGMNDYVATFKISDKGRRAMREVSADDRH